MNRLHQLAINEEGFIFDPSSGESYTVNPCALFIIQQLKIGKESNEIAEELINEYDDTHENLERDVLDFLSQLRTHRLL